MSKNVALYNKYRPKAWCDVVEQDAVKQILSNELQTGKIKRVLSKIRHHFIKERLLNGSLTLE